jgi:hypothetical protein
MTKPEPGGLDPNDEIRYGRIPSDGAQPRRALASVGLTVHHHLHERFPDRSAAADPRQLKDPRKAGFLQLADIGDLVAVRFAEEGFDVLERRGHSELRFWVEGTFQEERKEGALRYDDVMRRLAQRLIFACG